MQTEETTTISVASFTSSSCPSLRSGAPGLLGTPRPPWPTKPQGFQSQWASSWLRQKGSQSAVLSGHRQCGEPLCPLSSPRETAKALLEVAPVLGAFTPLGLRVPMEYPQESRAGGGEMVTFSPKHDHLFSFP